MPDNDVCARLTGVDDGRVAANHWAPSSKTIKMRIAYMTACDRACDLVIAPKPRRAPPAGMPEIACRGRSAIRRAATLPGSEVTGGLSGIAAISEANRWVAASPDKRANPAASCQGSRSSRANAEMTLSKVPFSSVVIGANRNALYSEPSVDTGAVRVISTTDFFRLYRTLGTFNARMRIKWQTPRFIPGSKGFMPRTAQ